MVQVAHLGWGWSELYPSLGFTFIILNGIHFFRYVTCRDVSLLLWQTVKFYRLTSTLLVEPGVIFYTITSSVISRNICFARLNHFFDILCPSRSAHCHHHAKSSTQCPLDFIKKHQAASWPTSYRLTFPETAAAAMFLRPCRCGTLDQNRGVGGFNTGSSHNNQLTI